jgi:hypothetical protein
MLDDMKRRGVIEESDSPWSFPVVLVRKKNGELRFCVDYRKLKDVTKKDSFPLPRIDDALDNLAEAKWFSTFDVKSGYGQVDVHPDYKEKTTFWTGQGLRQFTFLLLGLCNDPATFEWLMENILRGLSVPHLRKVVTSHYRDWDERLHLFNIAYRASTHDATGLS